MEAKVDKDLCTGCTLCVDTCPEVFEMEDDTAKVKVNPIPQGAKTAAGKRKTAVHSRQ